MISKKDIELLDHDGIEKIRQNIHDIIRHLLTQGMSVETIATAMNLGTMEVQQIKAELTEEVSFRIH